MAGNGNLQSHEKTYGRMINALKWGSIVVFLLTFLIIWLIA